MRQFLACARELLRSGHAPQHLLNSAPDRSDRAGFGQPWAATLRQKCLVVSRAAISSEKNHPLAERRRPLPQVGIERASVQLGHPQVTQDHVIVLRLELREGVPSIARRLDHVPVPLE
jgi:hypothetical protein